MKDRVIEVSHSDYQPQDEKRSHEVAFARNDVDWFERNRGVVSDQQWAETLGQKSAHFLARTFQDGHHAELARIAFSGLVPLLMELQERPDLNASFLDGIFREFRYLGLPYPGNFPRRFF
ncbi:hypothetical protein A3F00_01690 [Candidatus Daviesbacteria bacterium RIFCSPHIGHO2_12_FULL_37_11]|uniref:Uncharacterized protein n=1 Tax=Candidatus Daviesbacteria bacterium RIFCSPHIGHO2_12_FULL_37_11 TaxID=1797777 RepID=A0A1F5KCT2_9BACT|nr:MAG: hypothetical protein A2111_01545 [Candidatus Daviesbacteria bacterium GWA1_38_6]OGE16490.1 MAG: hypothetical protein A2769_02335 [Candidatus Daviesbacteria bacterium RIFCSPHIGHO2_01_FULL_37_27]OGE38585.1 MAG: hypothetical protein A3F00_01690 [Candidatus Daviesbacteria bacterium RIFCSPHIGHO2_12_FULL_37_11]OGE46296.1 MAG: hypothetical protein A3B39_03915 [Candidatus Daviesbacteria bacterium RIFCSPLOWO2_01_FULL_37_10]